MTALTLSPHDRTPGFRFVGPVPDMAGAVRDALASGVGPLTFCFAYGEIPVTGTLLAEGDGYRLGITAPVGLVPYSAEDHEARAVLRAAINDIGRARQGCIAIDTHQTIIIRADCPITSPVTAVSVISGLVALLVDVRPVFNTVADYLPDLRMALPAPYG